MQINITGHKMELTDSLKDYVKSKMKKNQRHFDHIGNVNVVMDINKGVHTVEVSMHVSGADLQSKGVTKDMYASIDSAISKMDRQIIKHKEKISSHNKKSGGVSGASINVIELDDLEEK